jgi:hypothetical protein
MSQADTHHAPTTTASYTIYCLSDQLTANTQVLKNMQRTNTDIPENIINALAAYNSRIRAVLENDPTATWLSTGLSLIGANDYRRDS